MRLERQYNSLKQMLAREKKALARFEAAEIVEDENNPFSVEERLQAKEKAIASCKENIKEYEEILEEIKVELYDFIYDDGEVSNKTIEDLANDLSVDASKEGLDNYDREVLTEKANYIKSLII